MRGCELRRRCQQAVPAQFRHAEPPYFHRMYLTLDHFVSTMSLLIMTSLLSTALGFKSSDNVLNALLAEWRLNAKYSELSFTASETYGLE